jgi:cation transport ATPase
VVDGVTILVGNRGLLTEHGIEIPRNTASADISLEVFVARDGRFLGVILIADTIRSAARRAVEALNRLGIRVFCSPAIQGQSPRWSPAIWE